MAQERKYRHLEELSPWEYDPRSYTKREINYYKKKYRNGPQEAPLTILPGGVVIGRQSRYRALKALKIDPIWVKIVYPDTKVELLEYAQEDNDYLGDWLDKDPTNRVAVLPAPPLDELSGKLAETIGKI